jgi:hypothetical protein
MKRKSSRTNWHAVALCLTALIEIVKLLNTVTKHWQITI